MESESFKLLLEEMADSPVYIFDEDILKERIQRLGQIGGRDAQICYAVKANPFLIRSMDALIPKYEVCSPGELEICLQSGIKMNKVVYSGVNKGMEDIEKAIACGVSVVTLESVLQLRMVSDCAKKLDKVVKVLPRLSNGAQFGIDDKELRTIASDIDKYEKLRFIGIQYFTGTQKKNFQKILEELDDIVAYADMLKEEYGYDTETIEFGPGLSVPYFEGDDFEKGELDFQLLMEHIRKYGKEYHYVLELGRYIAASCGHYVTKVVDVKKNGGRNYCIVDGGINHVNYYGQNMAMRVPVIEHMERGRDTSYEEIHWEADEEEWTICGSLCTFADLLVRKIRFNRLGIGDTLVFKNIGAYSITEGIYLFLSRKIPAVYLYDKERGLRLIRQETETVLLNSGETV